MDGVIFYFYYIPDEDECRISPCGMGAVCLNTPGSYICQCPDGYRITRDLQCEGEVPQILSNLKKIQAE